MILHSISAVSLFSTLYIFVLKMVSNYEESKYQTQSPIPKCNVIEIRVALFIPSNCHFLSLVPSRPRCQYLVWGIMDHSHMDLFCINMENYTICFIYEFDQICFTNMYSSLLELFLHQYYHLQIKKLLNKPIIIRNIMDVCTNVLILAISENMPCLFIYFFLIENCNIIEFWFSIYSFKILHFLLWSFPYSCFYNFLKNISFLTMIYFFFY